ncbi:hypothetical protein ATO6_07050 [Oceanicola sp. 22II-s10i]|uniref:hypothetical protein n=1 Tax=Oceanicola sp. 22II-s10i TaxID=1317116 RepID=UPI000B5286A7|nr:hypothetical protein [Oceanicola sp. 22II-s10i]OWU86538.1 hypothetical protein ATO6_07050 [Oceanicola sp. 22II-s10i]
MIVTDSIGFAATHTITAILSEVPGFRVSHGSQNFETGGPIGVGSQTPEAFAASMAQAAAEGARPVAVHTNFDPRRFRPACETQGIRYSLLAREPRAQINSCYAWASKKVLDGDDVSFLTMLKQSLPKLPAVGIRASLPNIVYAYAVQHVCAFNLAALETGADAVRMEEILADEAAFRQVFEVPDAVELKHFSGDEMRIASHRSQAEAQVMAEPERELIEAKLTVSVGGAPATVGDMVQRLGYAA